MKLVFLTLLFTLILSHCNINGHESKLSQDDLGVKNDRKSDQFINETSILKMSKRSISSSSESIGKTNCHIRPIIHLLKYPGCVPKSIPSFACQGRCSSYVQVSINVIELNIIF